MTADDLERRRLLAALLVERFGPLSTLHLERRRYVPPPVRRVVVRDDPADIAIRRRALLEATADVRLPDDLLDLDLHAEG